MRTVMWLEAVQGRRGKTWAALVVLLTAVSMFVAVFWLEAYVAQATAAVSLLMALPVALLAVSFGRLAGAIAAAVAIGGFTVWDVAGPGDSGGWLGYVTRGIAFLLVGVLPGWFAERVVHTQHRLIAAEQETKAAGERVSVVLDTIRDAVSSGSAVRDEAGRIVDFRIEFCNASSTDLFRMPPSQLAGRRWSEVWPERLGTSLYADYVRLVETGRPIEHSDLKILVPTPNGPVEHVVDLRVARLGDGYVATLRDVTARQRHAEALAAATAQFAAAFDHAPVGMALLDRDRVIVRANAALAAMTARSTDELPGVSLDALTDPRDLVGMIHAFGTLRAREAPTFRGELRLLTGSEGPRWVSFSTSLVAGSDSDLAVVHLEDIHERKSFEGRLQFLADHDALTGLFNRRRFHEELAHQVALDNRYGHGSVVLLIDLDNFKYINDTLGHQTGDGLIQAIARTLDSRLRDSDVVGRLGGDEFAVLLPGADVNRAITVAESLLAGIRDTVVARGGHRVRSTGSIGIARIDRVEVTDADDAMANADLAMYAAKESGRDCYVVYDPQGPHAARSRARFRWLDRIRYALEHDLFVLHAQPILDLATDQVTGAELLLRMRDDGGLVGPDSFLYVAERHGLANAIDRYVVTHAIEFAATQGGPEGFRWEINLSADSLGDPEIPRLIESAVARTGLSPSCLVFEITETAAVTNMDDALAFAERITGMGCRVALDDFGAGYGSFYYVKHLPFEYLKIDGEFIRQLATSETDRVIVQAIVSAARQLGKQTIAEYVGDADTLELLRAYSVDHAQGYYVGRPTSLTLPPTLPGQRAWPGARDSNLVP